MLGTSRFEPGSRDNVRVAGGNALLSLLSVLKRRSVAFPSPAAPANALSQLAEARLVPETLHHEAVAGYLPTWTELVLVPGGCRSLVPCPRPSQARRVGQWPPADSHWGVLGTSS